jgi:hypothetical protein
VSTPATTVRSKAGTAVFDGLYAFGCNYPSALSMPQVQERMLDGLCTFVCIFLNALSLLRRRYCATYIEKKISKKKSLSNYSMATLWQRGGRCLAGVL